MRFIKNIGWTTFAQITASAAAFTYTLITARSLGVQQYGLFQGSMGVYGLFSFVHLPFYFGSLHCVGRTAPENRSLVLGAFFTLSLVAAAAVLSLFTLLAPLGQTILKTSNLSVWFACAALIAVNTMLTLFHGSLQAMHRFPLFTKAKISEVILLLLGGTWMLHSGWGAAGAVLGYAFAMTCVLLYFIVTLKPRFVSWPKVKEVLIQEVRSLKDITLILSFILILENTPAIWARWVLSETESGYFGAVYNLRSTVWPFALAVTLTFYSHLLAGDSVKTILRQALLLITVLAAGFQIAVFFFSEQIISLLYGSNFSPAAKHLCLYGASLTLQMAALLLLFYRVGVGRLKLKTLFIALAVFFAMLYWGNRSITGIIAAQTAGAAVCVTGLIVGKKNTSGGSNIPATPTA